MFNTFIFTVIRFVWLPELAENLRATMVVKMAPCNDNNIATSMKLHEKHLIIPAERLKLLVARIVVRIAP